MAKQQTSAYKQATDAHKAQVRKDIRSGKVNPGNSPHEPDRRPAGGMLKVNVPKRKM